MPRVTVDLSTSDPVPHQRASARSTDADMSILSSNSRHPNSVPIDHRDVVRPREHSRHTHQKMVT